MTDPAGVSRNYQKILSEIAETCRANGRDPADVRVMAVTKGHDGDAVKAARKAGIFLFGENRVQEAIDKYSGLKKGVSLHLIGHLQRNKAKLAVGFFDCVGSIDKLQTAEVLEALHAKTEGRLRVMCEVNTSGEQTKNGFVERDDLFRAMERILVLPHISLTGLMTVGPLTGDETKIRKAFSSLRTLYENIRASWKIPEFTELSMGMSDDYKIAVASGATIVRIGTALFGRRE